MKLQLPRYLLTGALAILATVVALAVGDWNIGLSRYTPAPLVTDPAQPDFFMENPRILQRNEEGRPRYRLESEQARHLASNDSTELSAPRLLFYREDEAQPWETISRKAYTYDNADRVELVGDVQIEQRLPGQPRRKLSTEALTVFPPRDYAETDQDVKIEAARGVTTATGMQLYFNDGRVTLLSNVRGQHEVR